MALTQFAANKSSLANSTKVISAEVMMAQFIAVHNLLFLAADHLSSLFSTLFPDSYHRLLCALIFLESLLLRFIFTLTFDILKATMRGAIIRYA